MKIRGRERGKEGRGRGKMKKWEADLSTQLAATFNFPFVNQETFPYWNSPYGKRKWKRRWKRRLEREDHWREKKRRNLHDSIIGVRKVEKFLGPFVPEL